jgi:farnesyl diphosphate synthase
MKLPELFSLCETRLNHIFEQYLTKPITPSPLLQEAAAYSVNNGGKRLRPLFVYATGIALDASLENLDIPACAIEFIHSYSLVHDDLPAMDNADLRRGKPSCHKKFDEAMAILAGDTLQPLAFEIIASHPATLTCAQRLAMIKVLAEASGYHGMAAGQALDIKGIHNAEELIQMYQLKTGALLNASLQLGVIAANNIEGKISPSIRKFADCIGLAFQIQDDLLDIESQDLTGKPQGLDAQNNKPTYPTLFGIEQSKQKIHSLFAEGIQAIAFLGEKGKILQALAEHVMQRKK